MTVDGKKNHITVAEGQDHACQAQVGAGCSNQQCAGWGRRRLRGKQAATDTSIINVPRGRHTMCISLTDGNL